MRIGSLLKKYGDLLQLWCPILANNHSTCFRTLGGTSQHFQNPQHNIFHLTKFIHTFDISMPVNSIDLSRLSLYFLSVLISALVLLIFDAIDSGAAMQSSFLLLSLLSFVAQTFQMICKSYLSLIITCHLHF